jgi:phytanoyl-CoA hydroxylase
VLDQTAVDSLEQHGYAMVAGLFSSEEVSRYRDHVLKLRRAGSYPGDFVGATNTDGDPNARYPRMYHAERWDDLTRQWLLDERLHRCMTTLLGQEVLGAQTMIYFKPPGGRGTALHQDQYYLRVQPGTCIAAWIALERSDEENGCMQVVPCTHNIPLLCLVEADHTTSNVAVTVPIPDDVEVKNIVMEPGDALFFAGQLVHGSLPNTSQDRFRVSLACHYVTANAEKVSQVDRPLYRFDGTLIDVDANETGGHCGVWVDEGDQRRIEMSGQFPRDTAMERRLDEMNEAIWSQVKELQERGRIITTVNQQGLDLHS